MRRLDWPAALNAAIEAARNKPFAWGTHDCCMFAAHAVQEMTGADFAEPFRGRYSDATGALRVLTEAGGPDLIASRALGRPIPIGFAQRGDVIMVDIEGRKALAICLGAHAAGPGPDGLVFVPVTQWLKAWRV